MRGFARRAVKRNVYKAARRTASLGSSTGYRPSTYTGGVSVGSVTPTGIKRRFRWKVRGQFMS